MRALADRGWTLRRQLVVAVALLLVVMAALITVVTTVAMRTVLLRQVDGALDATGRRVTEGPTRFDRGGPRGADAGGRQSQVIDPRGCLLAAGRAPGTLCGVIATPGGLVTNMSVGFLNVFGTPQILDSGHVESLTGVPADARARSVDIRGLGSYRVVVSEDDGFVRVVGLPLNDVEEAVAGTARAAFLVTLAGVVAAVLVGNGLVGFALRPLKRVETTATRVSQLPLSAGEVSLTERVAAADTDERTEVGRVGATLNRLLGHVEASLTARQESETQVRRFVADASHELRTPLAAIRGYAELARRSPEVVPADVAHAMSRVESESVRMTGLVTDLLLLASLDSGRPLDRAPVDLSALVVDAVGDAHVAGPDHRWVLDVPAEPVTVVGDAPRLHQVVANLLANARIHTPAGTTVTITVGTGTGTGAAGDGVLLTVADDGPGVPSELVGSLFGRFVRGDSSRSRAAGSTGLGLAIAAAVVQAHGGTITVGAPPQGPGASFTVRLPG